MLSKNAFISLLASIIALTPLAIDLYLPAIPIIAKGFAVPENRIAIGVSLYMSGLVIGQLIAGPLSDKFGRKPLMQFGTIAFAIASLCLAICVNWQQFLFFRCLQALGGGVAVVGVLAAVRDRASGNEAATLLAKIGLIMTAAPAIAPALGSVLLLLGNWRWMFVFLALYAVVLVWVVHKTLALKKSAFAIEGETWWQSYGKVLSNRCGARFMIVQGLTFGAMLTFVVNASYLYQTLYSLNSFSFSALFAVNIVGMAVMNRLNVHLLKQHDVHKLAIVGVAIQSISACCLFLACLFGLPLVFVTLSIVVLISAQGMLMPNSTACALQPFPERAGVASAALGAFRYFGGAVISAFSTQFQNGESFISVAAVMLVASVSASLLLVLSETLLNAKSQS